jgi:hypothetical protein
MGKQEYCNQEEEDVPAQSKAALIALALMLSCSPIFAQGDLPDSPSDNHGAPDGLGPRAYMHRDGRGRDAGDWGRGRDGGDWGRGSEGFGRDGRSDMRGRGMEGREFGLGRLLSDPDVRQRLGVSAEQANKIRQQESDFRKTEIRGRADVEVKRLDLRDLLAADKPDRAAIDAKLQEISTARLDLEKSAVDERLNMREALTPAQREKLRQMMQERRQMRGGKGPQGARPNGQRGHAPPPPSSSSQAPASH